MGGSPTAVLWPKSRSLLKQFYGNRTDKVLMQSLLRGRVETKDATALKTRPRTARTRPGSLSYSRSSKSSSGREISDVAKAQCPSSLRLRSLTVAARGDGRVCQSVMSAMATAHRQTATRDVKGVVVGGEVEGAWRDWWFRSREKLGPGL